MAAQLAIGEFSRITHLSVKTLRHYHDVGLLGPDHVDAATGYRYYSLDQVPVAQVIRRLRDLDMPIADIRSVLMAEEPDTRNRLIVTHMERLEQQLANTREAVEALRSILSRPSTTRQITHRSVAPVSAIGIQQVVDYDDLLVWWQGALGELHATVRAQHLERSGPSGGLYASELFQHERGLAAVFVPIDGAAKSTGRVTSFDVPAAELAIMEHQGPLGDLDLTYAELGSYTTRHEISVTGPLYEYYMHGTFDDPSESHWHIEVGWPIFRADSTHSTSAEPQGNQS